MKRLVFSTEAYDTTADEICNLIDGERGSLERTRFADGERLFNISTPPNNRDVILVGGTIDDTNVLELFDIACGLVTRGTNTLTIMIPYFGYSTQERAVRSGDLVTAKARAIILSAIPRARHTNEVYVFDLHTDGIPHYFEGPMHCHHIKSHHWMKALVKQVVGNDDAVVAATDAGRAKWIEKLANLTGLPAAFVYKRRTGEQTAITGVNADVKGKHVVLYDDMVRSGSSMLKAAEAYRSAGAEKVTGIFSHGVLPGDSARKLVASGAFHALHTTDSHPGAVAAASEGIQVHKIAGLFADTVVR